MIKVKNIVGNYQRCECGNRAHYEFIIRTQFIASFVLCNSCLGLLKSQITRACNFRAPKKKVAK